VAAQLAKKALGPRQPGPTTRAPGLPQAGPTKSPLTSPGRGGQPGRPEPDGVFLRRISVAKEPAPWTNPFLRQPKQAPPSAPRVAVGSANKQRAAGQPGPSKRAPAPTAPTAVGQPVNKPPAAGQPGPSTRAPGLAGTQPKAGQPPHTMAPGTIPGVPEVRTQPIHDAAGTVAESSSPRVAVGEGSDPKVSLEKHGNLGSPTLGPAGWGAFLFPGMNSRAWERITPFYAPSKPPTLVESENLRLGPTTILEPTNSHSWQLTRADLDAALRWGHPAGSDLTDFEKGLLDGKGEEIRIVLDVEGGTAGYAFDHGSGGGVDYYTRYGELVRQGTEAGLEPPGFVAETVLTLGLGLAAGVVKSGVGRALTWAARREVATGLGEGASVMERQALTGLADRLPTAASSAGRDAAAIGQQSVLGTGTRQQFRREILSVLRKNPDHPMRFLLDAKGNFKRLTSRAHAELIDNPQVWEAAHIMSSKLGGERLMIQTAWENQVQNVTVEGLRGVGAGVLAQPVIDIGGFPVARASALWWESIGMLPRGTVAHATPR
jgi:hypothetical protein